MSRTPEERLSGGIPVLYAPAQFFSTEAHPLQVAMLAKLEAAVTALDAGEQPGILLPLSYDDRGRRQFELEWVGGTTREPQVEWRDNGEIPESGYYSFVWVKCSHCGAVRFSNDPGGPTHSPDCYTFTESLKPGSNVYEEVELDIRYYHLGEPITQEEYLAHSTRVS